MSMINYHDPTVINWNLNDNGQPISLLIQNETKQVVDGKIPLEGLPDEQYRIQITGYVEINIKDKIDASNKFKCDYTHGVLYFDQSKTGTSININKYYSRGQFYIPAKRVWTRLNSLGEIEETLDDVLGNALEISNEIQLVENKRVSNETVRQQKEGIRESNELLRKSNELTRQNSENTRVNFYDDIRQQFVNGNFKGSKGDKGDNGKNIEYSWSGTKLGIKQEGDITYSYSELKGEQGVQGIQGVNGDKGEKGNQGIQGVQGIQGSKGDKGDKGDSGISVDINGTYYFGVVDGDLILYYPDNETPPNFQINTEGELIYTV